MNERCERALETLRGLLGTDSELVPTCGPPAAALETALAGCVGREETLLVAVNGFAGRRIVELAAARGIQVRTVTAPETKAWDPAEVLAALDHHSGVSAVAAVHHEAAVGMVNPVGELCLAARERGLLTIVDATASFGACELGVDAAGIDVCVTSLDGLAPPWGIAPIAVSEAAWERALALGAAEATGGLLGWRWLRERGACWEPERAPLAPAALAAMGEALDELGEDGLRARLEAAAAAARTVRQGLRGLGFEPLVDDEVAAPGLTAAATPSGTAPADLLAALHRDGLDCVRPALEVFAARAVRVDHVGASAEPAAVERLLKAVSEHLRSGSAIVARGSGDVV